MLSSLVAWLGEHQLAVGWIVGISVAVFVGGLVAMPILVSRMRPDYFVRRRRPTESWSLTARIAKNVLGVILLIAGVGMLVLPGQGIITILVGLSLVDFPGKRRLELKIVRQHTVLRAINWIRKKADQPPLELPEHAAD